MPPKARISALSTQASPYECRHEWPPRTGLQCGDNGIVLEKGEMEQAILDPEKAVEVIAEVVGIKRTARRTAYFEAFPRQPSTFIRGEGATIEEAEDDCWAQYQRYLNCPGRDGHEFEARSYKNGLGFCKWCGLSKSHAIQSPNKCQVCGEPTWHFEDARGNYWCEDHAHQVPEEYLSDTDKHLREMIKRLEVTSKEIMNTAGIPHFHHYGEYPGAVFHTLAEVRAAVAESKEAAREEAAKVPDCLYISDRGDYISTVDQRGDQAEPLPGADAHPWGGTVSELKTVIDDVISRYQNVREIRIEGGFDGADSREAYMAGDYTPWVSCFSVVVWKRPES